MAESQAPENFDNLYNGNRAFILGGQTFHWEQVHWREWGKVIDARVAEEEERDKARKAKVAELVAAGTPQGEAEIEMALLDDETLVESFEKVVERCALYVEDDDAEAFVTTVNDPEKRVTIAQLNALMVWLQEVQTPDRPTSTLSPSSSGPGTQGAISPAV